MQHTPLEIKEKLLKAVDKEYNVLDMGTVVEVISILERTPITKEALEATRLGKYINELRRKTTNGALARRAKELVRQWRHLIAQPEHSPASAQFTSNHLHNGLTPAVFGEESMGSGLLPINPSVPPEISTSPPLTGGNTVNANIPVSPAVSVASSGRSSSSPLLQSQQSSALARHNTKKHSLCPSSPVAYNSQNRTHVVPRPDSPGLALTQVNQVLASDSVPKTHVANKRLRKDVTLPATSHTKLGQTNGGVVINIDLDSSCPSVEIIEECSGDSLGATSDRGSGIESQALSQNEVPQDNGLLFKNIHRCHKKVKLKGSKANSVTETSSQIPFVDDIVKEKIASIARIPKVKTTQELLADLQAKMVPSEDQGSVNSVPTGSRTSLSKCTLPSKHGGPSDALEISRNKTEHIAKFLRSQSALQELHRDQTMSDISKTCSQRILPLQSIDRTPTISRVSGGISPPHNDNDCSEKSVNSKNMHNITPHVLDCVNEEVSNILACLPPINYDEIHWEDEQDSGNKVTTSEETEPLVARLYSESVEGVNGNYSHEMNDVLFREWHETVVRPSYQEDLLNILPYVIID